jgi:hypothetical protein
MDSKRDQELLSDYVEQASESAFAELVRRWPGFDILCRRNPVLPLWLRP